MVLNDEKESGLRLLRARGCGLDHRYDCYAVWVGNEEGCYCHGRYSTCSVFVGLPVRTAMSKQDRQLSCVDWRKDIFDLSLAAAVDALWFPPTHSSSCWGC